MSESEKMFLYGNDREWAEDTFGKDGDYSFKGNRWIKVCLPKDCSEWEAFVLMLDAWIEERNFQLTEELLDVHFPCWRGFPKAKNILKGYGSMKFSNEVNRIKEYSTEENYLMTKAEIDEIDGVNLAMTKPKPYWLSKEEYESAVKEEGTF